MNCISITGNLVRDPELRKTNSGTPVAGCSVAVRRIIKGKDNQDTDFIDVVAWDKRAEYLCQYGHKGERIEVVGRLESRNYIDKDNKTIKVWEVVADNITCFGQKREEEEPKKPTKQEEIDGLPF